MFKRILLCCSVIMVLSSCFLFAFEQEKPAKKLLCVGVYDSRAVAIAFAASDFNSNALEEKRAELEKAKSKGDSKKIAELENWGSEHQKRMHKQGFGSAPVHDLLEYIKDTIPETAKKAGVDVIVSKWEIVYGDDSAEFVDVTNLLIEPFKPGERQLKWIEQMKDIKPVPEDELEKHEREGNI